MPSAPVYTERRKYKQCPRCGRRTKTGTAVLCRLHRKLAAEEKRRLYAQKRAMGLCGWSGCSKQAESCRALCKEHAENNRVAAAERKKKQKT